MKKSKSLLYSLLSLFLATIINLHSVYGQSVVIGPTNSTTSHVDSYDPIPICSHLYYQRTPLTGNTYATSLNSNGVQPRTNFTSGYSLGIDAEIWYTFKAQSAGTIIFTIEPNDMNDDYDFELFSGRSPDSTSGTSGIVYEAANFSPMKGITGLKLGKTNSNIGPGTSCAISTSTPDPFSKPVTATANQRFWLRVTYSKYYNTSCPKNVYTNDDELNGFTLNFKESTASLFDNNPPTIYSIKAKSSTTPPCYKYNKIEVVFTDYVLCGTLTPAALKITGGNTIYTASNISCQLLGVNQGNVPVFTHKFTFDIAPVVNEGSSLKVEVDGVISDACGNIILPNTCYVDLENNAPFPLDITKTATTGCNDVQYHLCVPASKQGASKTYVWYQGGQPMAGISSVTCIDVSSHGEYSVAVYDNTTQCYDFSIPVTVF